jgi:hypothetical protein
MLRYYWRLFGTAFHHSYGRADAISGAIGVLGPLSLRLLGSRDPDGIVGSLAWQIAFGFFASFLVVRLIAAPYWMHQEDEAKRKAERAEAERKRAELEAELEAEQTRRKTLSDQRSRREGQRSCLAELLREGDRLKAQGIVDLDQMKEWMRSYQGWIGRIESEVGGRFSPADATRLLMLDAPVDRTKSWFTGDHQKADARISAILGGLHKMLEALPRD